MQLSPDTQVLMGSSMRTITVSVEITSAPSMHSMPITPARVLPRFHGRLS